MNKMSHRDCFIFKISLKSKRFPKEFSYQLDYSLISLNFRALNPLFSFFYCLP